MIQCDRVLVAFSVFVSCITRVLPPAFIHRDLPRSNIYLLHVVYHLIHSVALPVSFRIKQTQILMWIQLQVFHKLFVRFFSPPPAPPSRLK